MEALKRHVQAQVLSSCRQDHNISNFDNFLDRSLPHIIGKTFSDIGVNMGDHTVRLKASDVRLAAPPLLPVQCIAKGSTLKSSVSCHLDLVINNEVVDTRPDIKLFDLPIMIGCNLCPAGGFGGEFIVSGKYRYIPSVKTLQTDRIMKFASHVEIRCSHPDNYMRSTSTLKLFEEKGSITIEIPFLTRRVQVGCLLSALGCPAARVRAKFGEDFTPLLVHMTEDQEAILETVNVMYGKPGTNVALNMLKLEILPFIGTDGTSFLAKAEYMMEMVRILRTDKSAIDDKDNLGLCKTVQSGDMMGSLVRSTIIQYARSLTKTIRGCLKSSQPVRLSNLFQTDRISTNIHSSIATGMWSAKRKGVSHQLVNNNKLCVLEQLRRVSSSCLTNAGKHVGPRMLNASMFGYLCAASTPEGMACGLVNCLAWAATLSPYVDPVELDQEARHQFMDEESGTVVFGCTGKILGRTTTPTLAVQALVAALPDFIGVVHCPVRESITLTSNTGRFVRYVIRVDGDNSLLPMAQLRQSGKVRLMCAENSMCTPLTFGADGAELAELTKNTYLGLTACCVPFFNHNQGPRLSYWTNMQKQSIMSGPVVANGSVTRYQLWYAQRPLVDTSVRRLLDDDEPYVNCVVAVLPHPCNQEDSLVFNRAAIDRGLFGCSSYITFEVSLSNKSTERFCIPSGNAVRRQHVKYDKITSSGLPRRGTNMVEGDVICGRMCTENGVSVDRSVLLKRGEHGTVHNVSMVSRAGQTVAIIVLRKPIIPEVGDKFSSRQAQKGVIGRMESPENLPYSMQTGIVPDITFSPLGLSSRMTTGKLLEGLLSKAAAIDGGAVEDTCDKHNTAKLMRDAESVLREAGLSASGRETYIDGISGEMINCRIFTGLVAYTRLVHLVSKKMYSRSTGPVAQDTLQPVQGRKSQGGIRLGTMEVDGLVSHAASAVITERMVKSSDGRQFAICGQCGFKSYTNESLGLKFCSVCKTGAHVKTVTLGNSSMTMVDYLMSMGISVKLNT